jgi:hypothetical protein
MLGAAAMIKRSLIDQIGRVVCLVDKNKVGKTFAKDPGMCGHPQEKKENKLGPSDYPHTQLKFYLHC